MARFCIKCGAQLQPDDKFCIKCGASACEAGECGEEREAAGEVLQDGASEAPASAPDDSGAAGDDGSIADGDEAAPAAKGGRRKYAVPAVLGAAAGLVLAIGVGMAVSPSPMGSAAGEVSVPELLGSTQEDAAGMLADANLKLGAVAVAYSDDYPAGQVSLASPVPGEKAAAGSEVDLTISKGPAPKDEPAAPVPQEVAPAPQQPTPDNYVLPESATHLYSEAEVSGLSEWDLSIARNEIYARHGRGFADQELAAYFASQSWYRQQYTPEQFDALSPSPLNDVERANAALLLKVEKDKKYGGASSSAPAGLSDAAVQAARRALGIPDSLDCVTPEVGGASWWEGGGMYLYPVAFYRNGAQIASALCKDDGTPARNIMGYNG
ncbi:YARHG domain-containing protein [Collinsella sp. BA40]|uniref:YARHG domain-containing protein n=1 Tax=Collinsella sp. BA40 TaxID=2560852 RepID=UPI0011C9F0BE|nr:YARHG domain-containing protein [Collinsella sp. BA40]TXF38537.1 YARHG domain-containing protein [Collinsella sp. BA40]